MPKQITIREETSDFYKTEPHINVQSSEDEVEYVDCEDDKKRYTWSYIDSSKLCSAWVYASTYSITEVDQKGPEF